MDGKTSILESGRHESHNYGSSASGSSSLGGAESASPDSHEALQADIAALKVKLQKLAANAEKLARYILDHGEYNELFSGPSDGCGGVANAFDVAEEG